MANNIGLFFNTSKNTRSFAEVLAQVQEYLASKYSTLITDNPEEQRQQITAYIAKYLNDYSLGVERMDHEALIDKLYTEMAEFSFLTPYLFASDVEEININSWKDTKITYGSSISPTTSSYVYYNPAITMPRIISTGSSKASIEAIKKYFCDEIIVRYIAELTGISYDDLITGKYKLLCPLHAVNPHHPMKESSSRLFMAVMALS